MKMSTTPTYSNAIDNLIKNLTPKNQFMVRNFINPGVDLPEVEMSYRFAIADLLLQGEFNAAHSLATNYELILESLMSLGEYREEMASGLWTDFFMDVEAMDQPERMVKMQQCCSLLKAAEENEQSIPEEPAMWLLRVVICDMRRMHRTIAGSDWLAQFEGGDQGGEGEENPAPIQTAGAASSRPTEDETEPRAPQETTYDIPALMRPAPKASGADPLDVLHSCEAMDSQTAIAAGATEHCPECGGTGYDTGWSQEEADQVNLCARCGGSGRVMPAASPKPAAGPIALADPLIPLQDLAIGFDDFQCSLEQVEHRATCLVLLLGDIRDEVHKIDISLSERLSSIQYSLRDLGHSLLDPLAWLADDVKERLLAGK